jgi:hypothetical protein
VKTFRVVAGRVVLRRVEQRAEFLVRAADESSARRVAEEVAADEDHDRMWSDHDLVEHDEVEAVRILDLKPRGEGLV